MQVGGQHEDVSSFLLGRLPVIQRFAQRKEGPVLLSSSVFNSNRAHRSRDNRESTLLLSRVWESSDKRH